MSYQYDKGDLVEWNCNIEGEYGELDKVGKVVGKVLDVSEGGHGFKYKVKIIYSESGSYWVGFRDYKDEINIQKSDYELSGIFDRLYYYF